MSSCLKWDLVITTLFSFSLLVIIEGAKPQSSNGIQGHRLKITLLEGERKGGGGGAIPLSLPNQGRSFHLPFTFDEKSYLGCIWVEIKN